MKVLYALQDMANDDMLRATRMSQPINFVALLGRLSKAVEVLEAKIETPTISKSPLDACEAWAAFEKSGFNFAGMDPRERRVLCTDPQIAVRPQMVQAVTKHLDVFNRVSTLYGFVGCYFTRWQEIEEHERLEAFLASIIREQNEIRRSRILAKWAEQPDLFSRDANQWIAMEAVEKHITVAEVCSKWFVAVPSQLAQSAMEAALNLAVSALINKPKTSHESAILADMQWIEDSLLLPSIAPECYRREMGRLILSNLSDRYESVMTRITALVSNDSRLGDPRLPQAQVNWRTMPIGAHERVLSWLAKETIEFFFNAIVGDENRRRANFWLRYAMKPGKIKDFQVALSDEDARLLRRHSLERVAYPMLDGAKTSAFMMQFEGHDGQQYVVVEFSETGNAAYIYDRRQLTSPPLSFRSKFFTIGQLKRPDDKYDRITHNGNWEHKAMYLLYELGIRP